MDLHRIGRSLLGATLTAALFAGTLRASEVAMPAAKPGVESKSPDGRRIGPLPPLPYAPTHLRSARTVAGTSAQSRVGDADEDKQRVPKPADESRRKPEPGVAPQTTDVTDESSCMGGCIGSFLEGLFSSEPSAPPPPPSIAPTGMAWLPGSRGEIHWEASISVWDGPGGEGAGRNRVGLLPPHTRVTVLESNASIEGLWLRVSPLDADGPMGWIESGFLGPFTEPKELPPDTGPLPPERYNVWLAVGGGLVGPTDLNLEYNDGGFRAEGQFLRALGGPWQLGAGVGFRSFKGTPRVLYTTPSVIEEPTNSTLQFLDVGLRGGQRFGTQSHGPRFTWLLGAGTVLVHEEADILVFSSSTGQQIDRREDSLSRWRLGGDLRLAVAWPVGSNYDIGLLLDGWIVDWRGEGELSLTTDFMTEPIHGFDAALCFSFGGR